MDKVRVNPMLHALLVLYPPCLYRRRTIQLARHCEECWAAKKVLAIVQIPLWRVLQATHPQRT